jgi:hypothetical protein
MDGANMERKKPKVASGRIRLRSLDDLDKRTNAARAAFDLRSAIADDLGGLETLSAMQKALVDNCALLGAALGDLAAKYLAGEGTDLAQFATLANAQRRLLSDLGLERRAKDVTLRDYVRGKAA